MKITIAPGDGIGPETMDVVLDVFRAARVPLEFEFVPMGSELIRAGEPTGIGEEALASVERTGILLKGPMLAPGEDGRSADHESVESAARRLWRAFADKRIYRILPGVRIPIGVEGIHLTMVKENPMEGYQVAETMVSEDVALSRRFTTRAGSRRLFRYVFEMAQRKGAKRVTCAHRADVMRLSDGLYREVFYEVASEYPEMLVDDMPVDRLARILVSAPENLEVVSLPNMDGDLITDLATGLVGGLDYAPVAHIGDEVSIFEPAHGALPHLAGEDRANPTALLLAGTMMLRHVGLVGHAYRIEDALGRTLEQLQNRKDLHRWISRFHTSVFRHFLLSELRNSPVPSSKPMSRNQPSNLEAVEAPADASLGGLTLPSMQSQLDGLA